MKNNQSQAVAILRHLKKGKSITAIDALRKFDCFRLAARIYDLRNQGHQIDCDMDDGHGRYTLKRAAR